ncbi:MAG: HNH endonuclease [Bdellovibrio sp.]|nr:HNH endonuclease [Bdellovibrio sp.]
MRWKMHASDFKKLSNTELDQTLKQAVRKERQLLSEILLHMVEVDRRKLFLTLAYPNLFDYLTKHIGYSAGSAQRRIDAARLSKEESPKVTHQQNESVRLEVTLTKAQWGKLNQMRELLSSSLPSGSWDEVLEYVSDKVITQKSPKTKITVDAPNNHSNEKDSIQTQHTKETDMRRARKPLVRSVRHQILKRDQCCQYQDQKTGKVCGTKWHLHADHIQPVWAEGSNDAKNLRILCASHNLEIYRSQAGISRRI